jgi:hypothetical protein
MRLKAVPPPPPTLDSLSTITDAAPLVPAPRDDVRRAIADGIEWISARESEEWVALSLTLGLLRETGSGLYRSRERISGEALGERFVEGVYGAEELVEALRDDGPHTAAALAERVPIPPWERRRHADPAAVHRERIERSLGWLDLCGSVRYEGEAYHLIV